MSEEVDHREVESGLSIIASRVRATIKEPVRVAFYFDPVCPWCWVTARWLMGVREHRPLAIEWRPFSLALKNEGLDQPEAWKVVQAEGHRALRAIESARATSDPEAVERLYIEMARRWHHDGERRFDLVAIFAAAEVEPFDPSAPDEPFWDGSIGAAMDEVQAVVGDDIGVPAIVFDGEDPVGFYGPIMSAVPSSEEGLRLFDGFITLVRLPGFFELKRSRSGRPDPGPRP